jgi:hypothetical protein
MDEWVVCRGLVVTKGSRQHRDLLARGRFAWGTLSGVVRPLVRARTRGRARRRAGGTTSPSRSPDREPDPPRRRPLDLGAQA